MTKNSARQGSPTAGDPESQVPDPLALPPWPSSARSDEEREKRARFERLWEAFQRGDFRFARQESARLGRAAGDPDAHGDEDGDEDEDEDEDEEVRLRALALHQRLRTDPLAIAVAMGAVLVFALALVSAYR